MIEYLREEVHSLIDKIYDADTLQLIYRIVLDLMERH